jgi:hypothetical protein
VCRDRDAEGSGPLSRIARFRAWGIGGRQPGPLGFASIFLAAPLATQALVKSMSMPPPMHTGTTMQASAVTWPLYAGDLVQTQVRQGELATCPVAAILAALAHTAWGKKRIKDLLA